MQFLSVTSLLGILALWLAPSQAAAPEAVSPLAHVAVVGASVSAGYGIGPSLLGGAVTLADVVNSSISIKHDPPRNLASTLAFLNWTGYQEDTSAALAKDSPSALIAVDYLFWSVHGVMPDPERMKQLDSALAGLEKLTCPILLGDLPDVTNATVGPSPMIAPAMMPSPATRDAANARIRDWAKRHANVTLVPLAELMKKLNDGSGIQLHGNAWTAAESARLLQNDHLHATVEGLVAIWIAAADSWLRSDSTLPESALELHAKPLLDAANLRIKR